MTWYEKALLELAALLLIELLAEALEAARRAAGELVVDEPAAPCAACGAEVNAVVDEPEGITAGDSRGAIGDPWPEVVHPEDVIGVTS